MQQSDERAIGGITNDLIQKDETVTWQARHLLRKRQLAVKITRMEPYNF